MIINNKYRKVIAVLVPVLVLVLAFCTTINVFAEDSSSIVETTFFGNLKDDGKGCGVYTILNLVIDILSMGVGILGVIGVIVVGIQYLTAGGNEQQTTKSKRRMAEIVIGLVAFAVLYAFTQWLLPGGRLNTTKCETVSDEELADMKAKEWAAKQEAIKKANENKSNGKNNSNNSPVTADGLTLNPQIAKKIKPAKFAKLLNKGKLAPSPVCTDCKWSERVAQTAELLSWPKGTARSKYHYDGDTYNRPYKSWSDLKGAKPNKAYRTALDKLKPGHGFSSMSALGADCGHFVTIVLKYSGHDREMQYGQAEDYLKQHDWKQVSTAKRGDVCISRPSFHIWIYLGKGYSAEANHSGKNFGHIVKKGCKSAASIWHLTDN